MITSMGKIVSEIEPGHFSDDRITDTFKIK